MADFAIYWRNFASDCKAYDFGPDKPLPDWRTNSERLFSQLKPGDRLWFFAAGEACGGQVATAAYLVNAFRVRVVVENTGDDPDYPRDDYRYTVWSETTGLVWIDPPVLADRLVRPTGHPIEVHIGTLLQGPRRLSDDVVSGLGTLLQPTARIKLGVVSSEV